MIGWNGLKRLFGFVDQNLPTSGFRHLLQVGKGERSGLKTLTGLRKLPKLFHKLGFIVAY